MSDKSRIHVKYQHMDKRKCIEEHAKQNYKFSGDMNNGPPIFENIRFLDFYQSSN